jgi:hypothetical protein
VTAEPVEIVTHGTIYAYRKGCRCELCKAANWRAQKAWREKAYTQPIPESAHGTVNGYKIYGCRCDRCKTANSDNRRRRRERNARMRKLIAAGLPADWEGDI